MNLFENNHINFEIVGTELTDEQADQVSDHLIECTECAREMLPRLIGETLTAMLESVIEEHHNKPNEPMFGFTEEEWQASDSLQKGSYMVGESRFMIDHSHEENAIYLMTREVIQIVNDEGIGEKEPRQHCMLVPMEQIDELIAGLVDIRNHMVENQEKNGRAN